MDKPGVPDREKTGKEIMTKTMTKKYSILTDFGKKTMKTTFAIVKHFGTPCLSFPVADQHF